MTVTDWTAIVAIVLSGGAFLLELRRWVESGVQIRLSLMADAISFPHDDGKSKLILTATNCGVMPTTVTHMILNTFKSPIHRWLRKAHKSYVVNSTMLSPIPQRLEASDSWMGQANYNDEVNDLRQAGKMFVGVVCSNRSRSYLVKVPPKKPIVPVVGDEL